MRKINWLFMCLMTGAFGACSSDGSQPGSEEDTGQLALAITSVPSDVACVTVSVKGSRSLTQSFDVSPGASANYAISKLPLGVVSVSAEAFRVTVAGARMEA